MEEDSHMPPFGPAARAIQSVIVNVNQVLSADGGSVALLEHRGDTIVLRYQQGSSKDCPECVLSEESVVALIQESLALQAPFITNVRIAGHE
jgi:Fe-S cluster biogenesis protein NfuA